MAGPIDRIWFLNPLKSKHPKKLWPSAFSGYLYSPLSFSSFRIRRSSSFFLMVRLLLFPLSPLFAGVLGTPVVSGGSSASGGSEESPTIAASSSGTCASGPGNVGESWLSSFKAEEAEAPVDPEVPDPAVEIRLCFETWLLLVASLDLFLLDPEEPAWEKVFDADAEMQAPKIEGSPAVSIPASFLQATPFTWGFHGKHQSPYSIYRSWQPEAGLHACPRTLLLLKTAESQWCRGSLPSKQLCWTHCRRSLGTDGDFVARLRQLHGFWNLGSMLLNIYRQRLWPSEKYSIYRIYTGDMRYMGLSTVKTQNAKHVFRNARSERRGVYSLFCLQSEASQSFFVLLAKRIRCVT